MIGHKFKLVHLIFPYEVFLLFLGIFTCLMSKLSKLHKLCYIPWLFIILILKLETVDSLKDTFVYYFIYGAGGIILNGYMIFSEHNLKWIFPAYAVVDVCFSVYTLMRPCLLH